ncbi:MAG: lipoate--protein ligase family protein [Bacteroidota bacterium]
MTSAWVFADDGAGPGGLHMRRDEEAALRVAGGGGPSVLRVYTWRPHAVSLGRNQQEGELDLSACRVRGLDVVRRPTGGRAILHAEELTYSIVMPSHGRSVSEIYRQVCGALLRGLAAFGVRADFRKAQADFPRLYGRPSSAACFAGSARHEIEWKGRKLVGSAQRRYGSSPREAVLQHGSILTGPSHRMLVECLAGGEGPWKETLRREMREHTVDLGEILGKPPDLGSLAECIRRGFAGEWGVEFRSEQVPHPGDVHA